METVTALIAAAAALGLSAFIGRSITTSMLLVALGGLVSGIVFAIVFFILTVTVGALVPDVFDPWLLGVHFILLLMVAPVVGAVVATVTHWRVERLDAMRLPF